MCEQVKKLPAAGAAGGQEAQNAMMAQIRAQREKAEARGPIEDPLEKKERLKREAQGGGGGGGDGGGGGGKTRRASDARRGSSADRRAWYEAAKTSLSASFSLLGMATGALAGGGRTSTDVALAERLFSTTRVEDVHVREAARRLSPQRATLIDAMEVEVRARAHALDDVAASA